MRRLGWQILITISVLGIHNTGFSADSYVSASGSHTTPYDTWETAATNLADAVAHVGEGETCWVADGEYTVDSEINVYSLRTIRSMNGRDSTTLKATGANRIFHIYNPGVVDGFTITNAHPATAGGAVYLHQGGTLLNSIIEGCSGTFGGAIYFWQGGTVSNCIIRNNSSSGNVGGCALDAGGLLVDSEISWNNANSGQAGGVNMSGGIIRNCTIKTNSCTTHGGGVYATGSSLVDGCTIEGNTSGGNAGGIHVQAGVVVSNCTIISNHSTAGSAGGIDMAGGGLVSDSVITGNSSANIGGIYIYQSGVVENCEITKNYAPGVGGVTIYDGATVDGSILRNCLVAGNEATTGHSGGIRFLDYGTVENCTIVYNKSAQVGGGFHYYSGTVAATNNIVWYNEGSSGGNISGAIDQWHYSCSPSLTNPGNNNTTGDPNFTDLGNSNAGTNAILGDYSIASSTSPCVNSGLNLAWMSTATDLDGNARISGGTVDMGAYEFTPSGTLLVIQ